jgi:hypothetical protein
LTPNEQLSPDSHQNPGGLGCALSNANTRARTMSFNNGAGPGVWVVVGGADGGSGCTFKSSRPFQSLRLLAEDAQLETKRSNEVDPS